MVRLALRLLKRSLRPPDDAFIKFAKPGALKWRDYKPDYVDPPYWYRWSTESPYHPSQQNEMTARNNEHKRWYKHNYKKFKITEPDKWLVQVGDVVEVLKGKDAGKQSTVLQIIPERNWVVLNNLNCTYDDSGHMMRSIPNPMDYDEVALLDPKDGKPTEVEIKADDKGNRVRVSKRSGYIIPDQLDMLWDGTYKAEYHPSDKDTSEQVAKQRTYVPTMKTWENELNELFGFKDPPRRKTYWY